MSNRKTSVRECVFCRGPLVGNKSKEHIFPQWLQAYLDLKRQPIFPTLYTPSGEINQFRKMTFSGYVSGNICSRCNSGWMSELETDVRPLLVRFIDGTYSGILQAEHSQLLAFWIFKTALALHSISIQGMFIPELHYHEFNDRRSIPSSVAIAIAQLGSQEGFYWIQNQNWPGRTDSISLDDLRRTYKITFRLGQFAARVHCWPLHDRFLHEYFAECIGYIWYFGPRTLTWPMTTNHIKTLQEFEESLIVGRNVNTG